MKYNRSMYTGSYSPDDFVFFWGHMEVRDMLR